MENNKKERMQRDDLATITASICGVSDNYVRKVNRMERDNEVVVTVYMTLLEFKNAGIAAAKEIVAEHRNQLQTA